MAGDPPSPETVQEVAKRLRALAEPVRLRILYELRSGELSVGQLVERMGCSQPNVSRHLGQLHRAGMVTRRQDGKSVRYAIGDELVFEICDSLCGRVREEVEKRYTAGG